MKCKIPNLYLTNKKLMNDNNGDNNLVSVFFFLSLTILCSLWQRLLVLIIKCHIRYIIISQFGSANIFYKFNFGWQFSTVLVVDKTPYKNLICRHVKRIIKTSETRFKFAFQKLLYKSLILLHLISEVSFFMSLLQDL